MPSTLPVSRANPLSPRTRQIYEELASRIAARQRAGLKVLGINGAQGSGKSTLAAFLVEQLRRRHQLHALAVSIDDFYLGRAARQHLAADVHPLLITRGVPGTHDAQRGIDCLKALRSLLPGQTCTLPVFSKADDDCLPPEQARRITVAPELILFEGWCVGTPAQDDDALIAPVNDLERTEDADGRWRRYVNKRLGGIYARWFAHLDALIHLRVPGWNEIRCWRAQQERDTAVHNGGHSVLLDDQARERFLQHYQRLTEHAARTLPARANAVVEIDQQHDAARLHWR